MKHRLCVFSVVFALLCSLALPSFAVTNDDVGSGSALVSDSVYSLSFDTSLYDLSVAVSDVQSRYTMTNLIRQDAAGHIVTAFTVSGSADSAIDAAISGNAQAYVSNVANLYNLTAQQQLEINALNDSLSNISKGLGFPDGKTFYAGGYRVPNYDGTVLTTDWANMWYIYLGNYFAFSTGGVSGLLPDGTTGNLGKRVSGVQATLRNNMGLAAILRGQSGASVSGSLLNYSDLSATKFSANNLLSMLSPLLSVQNDVARLAHVVADPLDQALSDANKENREEVVNSFGSGDAAVKPSNIGDMAGVSGSLSGNLDTGVSVGQAFDQMNDSSRFAFFSQECQDALNPFHSARARSRSGDEDFVHFYDPDNSAFWVLIGGDE